MIYAQEYFAEIVGDLAGMPAANLAEADGAVPLAIDEAAYRLLEDAGSLRVYTARKDGALAGYVSFIVADTNLHHKGLKYASTDALYIAKTYRGLTGTRLMLYAERELRQEGVRLIALNVPLANDWSALARHWGYVPSEVQMRKWL